MENYLITNQREYTLPTFESSTFIMANSLNDSVSCDNFIVCPYNNSHLIRPQRMQVHLIRCRRSYPNAPVVICPFNITHRVNKVELKFHVASCPSRQNFEHLRSREDANAGSSATSCSEGNNATMLNITTATSTINGGEYVEPSECWDNEPDHPGYNPLEHIATADVLRNPVGMTPSQRKAFRKAEHKRLQNLHQ